MDDGIVVMIVMAVYVGIILALLWPYALIAQRVGITKWFVVTQFIPIVNIIALWYLALTMWKIDAADHRVTIKNARD